MAKPQHKPRADDARDLIEAIDEALAALPRDLLGHVRGGEGNGVGRGIFTAPEQQLNTRADAEVLWKWIREHLRFVLEALGRDKKAASTLAKMLPTPKRLSPGVVRTEEQRQKDAAFLEVPAVCLWALWDSWAGLTGMRAIPNVADWPGVEYRTEKRKGSPPINWLLATIHTNIGVRINVKPGEAANCLRRGLKDLRGRLVGSQAEGGQDTKPEHVNPTLQKAAAFIRQNPGSNADAVGKHCGVEAPTVRNFAPTLKKMGFTSRKGCTGGYWPPDAAK